MGKFKDDHKLKSSSPSPRDESMSKSRRSHSSSEHHSRKVGDGVGNDTGLDHFVGQKGRVPARPESWPVETDNTPSYPLTKSNNNVEDYEISDDQRYTTEETKLLARIYIDVSKDQRGIFWERVATEYNEFIPVRALHRDCDQLRKHWARMQKDVSKFDIIFTNCQKMQASSHSLDDIRQQAKDAFFGHEGRMFEYEDVWAIMRSNPKLFRGSEASSVPKRARVSTSGQDSVSGASIDLDTAMEETLESRPVRKGKAVAAPSIAPAQDPQLDEYSAKMEKLKNAILNRAYKKMLARDTSSMSEKYRKWHQELLDLVRSQVIKK